MTPALCFRAISVLLAASLLAGAAAQSEVSGTIQGTLGGEERTWYTIRQETPEKTANTAEWSVMPADIYAISIQGHREERFAVEGTLNLEFTFFGLPEECPCTPGDAHIIYFATSISQDLYEAEDPEVTLRELEVVDDETLRLAGEFRATLYYRADMMSELDLDESLEVEGTFEVTASLFELNF